MRRRSSRRARESAWTELEARSRSSRDDPSAREVAAEADFGGKAVHRGAAVRASLPVPEGLPLSADCAEAVACSEKRAVWESISSAAAIAYRRRIGAVLEARIGVVVQRLLQPRSASDIKWAFAKGTLHLLPVSRDHTDRAMIPMRRETESWRSLLAAVALAATLVPLNSTMIVVALPDVMRDLHAGLGGAGWLVTGYLIAMAVLQPAVGRLGDRLGRRTLLLLGLACFGLASVAASLASSLPELIAYRVLQAVGGSAAFANGIALVRERASTRTLGSRFGLVQAALPVGAAAGPPLGGVLVALGGWRAIFVVNLPIVLAAGVLVWRAVPGRDSSVRPVSLAGLRLRGPRSFVAAAAAVGLSNLAMYSVLLVVPIVLSARRGWTSEEVGLMLASLTLPMIALAPLGGRLADRLGRRAPAFGGLSLLALGLLPLLLGGRSIAAGTLAAGLAIAGAGLGLCTAALHAAAIEAVDVAHAGVTAGLVASVRYAGGIAGSLLVAALITRDGGGDLTTVLALLIAAAAAAAALSLILPGAVRAGRVAESRPGESF